jgi:hypothetical protein
MTGKEAGETAAWAVKVLLDHARAMIDPQPAKQRKEKPK